MNWHAFLEAAAYVHSQWFFTKFTWGRSCFFQRLGARNLGVAFYNYFEEGGNLEVSICLLKKKRASKAIPSLSSQSLLSQFGRLWNWPKRKKGFTSPGCSKSLREKQFHQLTPNPLFPGCFLVESTLHFGGCRLSCQAGLY